MASLLAVERSAVPARYSDPCGTRHSEAWRGDGDGCAYLSGSHLVVERTDRNDRATRRQIAYLYRGLRDYQNVALLDPSDCKHYHPWDL